MSSKSTANYGAAQERAALKRFIKRHRVSITVEALLAWIDTRAARASKRKGGLGRR